MIVTRDEAIEKCGVHYAVYTPSDRAEPFMISEYLTDYEPLPQSDDDGFLAHIFDDWGLSQREKSERNTKQSHERLYEGFFQTLDDAQAYIREKYGEHQKIEYSLISQAVNLPLILEEGTPLFILEKENDGAPEILMDVVTSVRFAHFKTYKDEEFALSYAYTVTDGSSFSFYSDDENYCGYIGDNLDQIKKTRDARLVEVGKKGDVSFPENSSSYRKVFLSAEALIRHLSEYDQSLGVQLDTLTKAFNTQKSGVNDLIKRAEEMFAPEETVGIPLLGAAVN